MVWVAPPLVASEWTTLPISIPTLIAPWIARDLVHQTVCLEPE